MAETAAPPEKPQTLDDIMIAMDVVDTLRHREDLVRRELERGGARGRADRAAQEDLPRPGHRGSGPGAGRRRQGAEGEPFRLHAAARGLEAVAADGVGETGHLRQARWARSSWCLLALPGRYYFLVARPARLAEEQARIEITETLPKALRQAHAEVLAIATDEAAKQKADALLADGEREIRSGNRAGVTKIKGELDRPQGRADPRIHAHHRVASRRAQPRSGAGLPASFSQAKNYYLIVEAIAPDGRKLSLPIRNEETGETETVTKFGVRVPEAVYEAVRQDKANDGIVQKNLLE